MKKRKNSWKILGVFLAGCWLLCAWTSGVSAGSNNPWSTCSGFLKKKQVEKAASCFERLVNDPNARSKAQSNPVQRKLRGFYIINAARLYQRVAKNETNTAQRAYLYERAGSLLQRYLDEKLCESYRCQIAQGMLWDTTRNIQHANLHLLLESNHPVEVKLRGFRHKQNLKLSTNWSGKLRPGTYKLSVLVGGNTVQELEVELLPNKSKFLTLKAEASEESKSLKICKTLKTEKKQTLTASCFQALASTLKQSTDKKSQLRKGTYLQHAAEAFLLAAAASRSPEKASYFNEQARNSFQLYLKERLCPSAFQCKLAQGKLWQATKAIQYANLTLHSSSSLQILAELEGYRFQERVHFQNSWQGKLRPGPYRLRVTFRGHSPQEVLIQLSPNQNRLIKLYPSDEKKTDPAEASKGQSASPLPWIVGGAGLAITIAGAILLLVGNNTASSADQQAADENAARAQLLKDHGLSWAEQTHLVEKWAANATAIQNTYNTGVTQATAGGVILGVGAATTLTGVVLLLLPKARKKKTTASTPPTQAALVHFQTPSF